MSEDPYRFVRSTEKPLDTSKVTSFDEFFDWMENFSRANLLTCELLSELIIDSLTVEKKEV